MERVLRERKRERERERERELRINAIITNEKKKYNFVFDESADNNLGTNRLEP